MRKGFSMRLQSKTSSLFDSVHTLTSVMNIVVSIMTYWPYDDNLREKTKTERMIYTLVLYHSYRIVRNILHSDWSKATTTTTTLIKCEGL